MNMNSDKTILIAEDEDFCFTLLKYIFEHENIRILWARTGLEAVDLFKNNDSIDLILMDIKMPRMSGIEALTKIREIRENIPVIAVTAYAMDNNRTECLDAGFNEYVTKPFDRLKLISLVNKYI